MKEHLLNMCHVSRILTKGFLCSGLAQHINLSKLWFWTLGFDPVAYVIWHIMLYATLKFWSIPGIFEFPGSNPIKNISVKGEGGVSLQLFFP